MILKEFKEQERESLLENIIEEVGCLEENIIERKITFRKIEEVKIYFEDILTIHDNILVSYIKTINKFEDSQEYTKIKEKLDKVIQEYIDFPNTMIEKTEKQKSNQKGCANCKSSINKDLFVKNTSELLDEVEIVEDYEKVLKERLSVLCCPICKDNKFVITETDENKLKVIKNKLMDILSKVNSEEMEFNLKNSGEFVNIMGIRD